MGFPLTLALSHGGERGLLRKVTLSPAEIRSLSLRERVG